mmetsp:Transcript_7956/g.15503  ORF Transcript_7956/g.15503 Transcript_7956/m.15503 type:complete len:179 (+) Transcript_7956:2856-3392(+)
MNKSETAVHSKGPSPGPGFTASASGFHRPKKNLVGSAKAGMMNYLKDMRVFSRDYMPQEVRKIVAEVKDSTALDILGVKPTRWNTSSYVERTVPYDTQMTTEKKYFEIRSGLRDTQKGVPLMNLEALMSDQMKGDPKAPKFKPKKIYPGTAEIRDDYTGWNVSTEVQERELKARLEAM